MLDTGVKYRLVYDKKQNKQQTSWKVRQVEMKRQSWKFGWPWKGPFYSFFGLCLMFTHCWWWYIRWQLRFPQIRRVWPLLWAMKNKIKKETGDSLNFSSGDGRSFVVLGQTDRLLGDSLENIVQKAVHDWHGSAGDAGIWVNLLHYFVNVDGIVFFPLPLSSLTIATNTSCFSLTVPFSTFSTDSANHRFVGRRIVGVTIDNVMFEILVSAYIAVNRLPRQLWVSLNCDWWKNNTKDIFKY